jgi:hypothetical protein
MSELERFTECRINKDWRIWDLRIEGIEGWLWNKEEPVDHQAKFWLGQLGKRQEYLKARTGNLTYG